MSNAKFPKLQTYSAHLKGREYYLEHPAKMSQERHIADGGTEQELVRRNLELEEELDKAIADQASIRSKLEAELGVKRALLKKEIALRLSLQRENRSLLESQNKLRHLLAIREGDLAVARRSAKHGASSCLCDFFRSVFLKLMRKPS